MHLGTSRNVTFLSFVVHRRSVLDVFYLNLQMTCKICQQVRVDESDRTIRLANPCPFGGPMNLIQNCSSGRPSIPGVIFQSLCLITLPLLRFEFISLMGQNLIAFSRQGFDKNLYVFIICILYTCNNNFAYCSVKLFLLLDH